MIELPVIDSAEEGQETSRERFWRSAADLHDDPELRALQAEEFMPGAKAPPSGATRRQFLQIMGASMAMAGLTACRRPIEKTLPYTRQPEEVIPGEPLYYATATPFRGLVQPALVESHEGRPTKIEGNPEHPMSRGASSVFQQASILELYDPDRSTRILREGAEATWRDFLAASRQIRAATGTIVVLAEPTSSPTLLALRARMQQQIPNLRWITYREQGDDPELLALQRMAGRPVRTLYWFSRAEVIVSLEADFLSPTEPNFVHNTAEFAAGRRISSPNDEPNRLYVVESNYSITGGNADNRRRLRSSEIRAFAEALADRFGVGGSSTDAFANDPFLDTLARDLRSAGSNGLVIAGETQPVEVHMLAAAINNALGAVGTTVAYLDIEQEPEPPQSEHLQEAVALMNQGQVDAVLLIGVNPVYSAPPELNIEEALRRAGETIHVGLYVDETARACRWHIPRAHYLEAWGDGRAADGTLSVIQPLIAPLYENAKSEIEVLNAVLTGTDRSGYDLVRERWGEYLTGDVEAGWRRVLHDGFLANTGYSSTSVGGGAPISGAGQSQSASDSVGSAQGASDGGVELVFHLDPTLLDGRFANNAWLMELPDPTTKIVWDNVALMSQATAERLGVRTSYNKGQYDVDIVEITVGDRSVRLPAWVQPGLADESIHVTFGYGREISTTRAERERRFFDLDHYIDIYGSGPLANGVGQNVSILRSAAMERVLGNVSVENTRERYTISTTQEHGSMEGRSLYRQASVDAFRQNPAFADLDVPGLPEGEEWTEYRELWAEQHPQGQPAFKDSPFAVNSWGMVIDLNTCTGCNSCIVACNSENNIPMVGKDEVGRGREMHWLRIDRYFVSDGDDVEDPDMVFQPVLCMHCEDAPCEPVCPVAATVHSADGLNEMVYNRCIGTRYCSNNCPYKVRRFNYFNWAKTLPATATMARNPDVTVRFRGVMEKCTYCVQRIRQKQRQANIENRPLQDGEIQTACQQACPAEAIVFGDLNDPNSAVSRAKRNSLNYGLLAEIGTKPRTTYLARVNNPNRELTSEPI